MSCPVATHQSVPVCEKHLIDCKWEAEDSFAHEFDFESLPGEWYCPICEAEAHDEPWITQESGWSDI